MAQERTSMNENKRPDSSLLSNNIGRFLEDNKIQEVVVLDVSNKTDVTEYMIIGTGTSKRHINAVSELLRLELKRLGLTDVKVESDGDSDWVLIDVGPVIVHLFQREIREFYELEKLWA